MTSKTIENPLFSIVIPVYNTENYVAEAIESIVRQSSNMFSRTEVLLVDDGSTDQSARICQGFVDRYPANIKLLRKENSGTSASKNLGIEHARGEYVGFLDSDDLYEPNMLADVSAMFAQHREVQVASVPMKFFGSRSGAHRLNKKFNPGTRVIDVRDDWQDVQLSSASSFVRRELLERIQLRFDTRIHLAEDAKFITEVIMDNYRLGLVASAAYMYRKRDEGSSTIDTFKSNKESYISVVKYAWDYLLEKYRNSLGIIPKYVQNVAMHDMEWRLTDKAQYVLNSAEQSQYEKLMRSVLQRIDVDVIMSQRFLGDVYKIYALSIKYGEDVFKNAERDGVTFFYRGHKVWRFVTEGLPLRVDYLNVDDGKLELRGVFSGIHFPGMEIGILRNGVFHAFDRKETPQWRKTVNNGHIVFEPFVVEALFPAVPGDVYHPAVRLGDKVYRVRFLFEHMARLPRYGGAHRVFGDIMLTNFSNRGLAVEKVTTSKLLRREVGFSRRILRPLKRKGAKGIALLAYRWAAQILKLQMTRKIWLVSDRPYAAGDNGEAFFRYLREHTPPNVDAYFVIRKDSPEWSKMKRLGKVIDPRSALYPLLLLLSEKVISSQADDVVINAFGGMKAFISDMYQFEFTFLQHGLTKDDLSGWLNKNYKDIRVFVTSSPFEQASIATEQYGYTSREVVLTGMPRFDRLVDRSLKKIVFAPTWRQQIALPVDAGSGQRPYAPGFTNSRYYRFIQELLTHSRLNAALDSNGYEAELFLHPNHEANSSDFTDGDRFKVSSGPHDYAKMFAEAKILITDYSSVAFDFAYLRKPVIYTQFDHDEFFSGHSYNEGYFSYENDGFGPVTYEVEATVDAIIAAMANDGEIAQEYRERVDRFFAFSDRRNSERTLEAIIHSHPSSNESTGETR
ncbi:bifunctional glycosyltransferase/CDP-glycerol:glycerophosphate glycerophosphotransferase [Arcanobacterium canis]